jgi:hypothetical protein
VNIADVFFKAQLDDSGLQVDAKRAGDKAGQTLGSQMSSAIGTVLKRTAFAGLTAATAIAGKGMIELQNITADFAAETGASADEADRAGKAINAMASRNLQPMSEIGKALTKVHTDLGLTGEAAEKTTEAFLKYATATKQNASEAVKSFDDILDAWGLTAEDATGIMDKLIVSHQRYGGSITENQTALGKMAPQLKALNLSVDDSISLFGLFATKGIDAAETQRALNTAVQKLPPGTSLKDFIKVLSAIEDPAERAKKAIEVFGSRGGVALANALGPGVDSLDDFAISADDAAGATQRASDVIEGTFSNQVALRIKAVGSAIIGVGQSIGPLATGLVSLASLGGMLGLDRVLGRAWTKVATSSVVSGAVKFAAGKAATLYLAGLIAGDTIGAALSTAWTKAANSGPVRAAVDGAGKFMGSTLGKIASVAFAGVLVLEAVDTFKRVTAEIASERDALLAQNKGFMAQATTEQLKAAREGVAKQAAELGQVDFGEFLFGTSAAKAIGKQSADQIVSELDAEIARRSPDVAAATAGLGPAINDGLERSRPVVRAGITAFVGKIKDDLAAADFAKEAHKQALRAGAAVASGIRDKRNAVDQAWNDLLDGLKDATSETGETARLLGHLVSKELIAGLSSGDPAVRAQAAATKQIILDRLEEVRPRAGTLSKAAMDELRKGMKSKDPDIRAASTSIYNAAVSKIKTLPPKALSYGKAAGEALADGIESKQHRVEQAASRLAGAAGSYWKISSPAEKGPWSTLGGPEGWGQRVASFLARGIESGIPEVNRAMRGLSGLVLPSVPAMSLAHAVPNMNAPLGGGVMPSSSSVTNNRGGHTFNIQLAGSKSTDPFEVPRQLLRMVEFGTFDPEHLK